MEKNATGKTIPIIEKGKPTTPEEIQKGLQSQIEKFQRLQKIIFDRETFINKKKAIADFNTAIKSEAKESAELETKVCKIILQDSDRYNDKNVIVISNRLIIEKFISFVTAEIDIKVNELEKLIVI